MTLQVAAYPQATVRVDAQDVVTLPCELWKSRRGGAAERAALYQDADPNDDPPLVGAGPEACAVCHYE